MPDNEYISKNPMKKNIIIAITVVLGLCILYWGISFLKGINLFEPANHYYARFERVDGLVTAAPVTVNGFQVGQVKEIQYDYKTNKIAVLLNMNKNMVIPEGSTVSMVSSLMGSASLALTLGPGPGVVKKGSDIPTAITSGLLDKITSETMPTINGIMPKVDSVMDNINGLTGDPALAASVARLDAITAQLAQASMELTRLMQGLNQQVPGVMGKVDNVMGKVDGLAGNLNGTASNLNQFSSSLNQMQLDQTVAQLNATLANLKQITSQLNDKNGSMGKLINDPALYDNANNLINSLDSLLTDLKAHPKKYVNIKVF